MAELTVKRDRALVHAEGWQSWTPTTAYRMDERQWLPRDPGLWVQGYGGSRPRPPDGVWQGDGLVCVDPGTGEDVVTVGARNAEEIPVVRCTAVAPDRLQIRADLAVAVDQSPAAGGLEMAKAQFAQRFAAAAGAAQPRQAPAIWCSWYGYFADVTPAAIHENLRAVCDRELPVAVIQIDDGYCAAPGDWLSAAPHFGELAPVVDPIRAAGLRAGVWTAPFLAGAQSRLVAEHPDWLLRGSDSAPVRAVHNWGQDNYALDLTHPGVAEYLSNVFATFTAQGIDFFKIDFLYAGALAGSRHRDVSDVQAYRDGLATIRAAVGPHAYLLGCGAPLLPSVGAVDGMRVGPDTNVRWAAAHGDLSLPSGEAAEMTSRARAYQHGRYWATDPDCLLVAPGVERREQRVELIRSCGGLRGSSDRLLHLDDWGLQVTAQLLGNVPAPVPFA